MHILHSVIRKHTIILLFSQFQYKKFHNSATKRMQMVNDLWLFRLLLLHHYMCAFGSFVQSDVCLVRYVLRLSNVSSACRCRFKVKLSFVIAYMCIVYVGIHIYDVERICGLAFSFVDLYIREMR